jgi:hypothetical protein
MRRKLLFIRRKKHALATAFTWFLLAVFIAYAPVGLCTAEPRVIPGPFRAESLTFYFVHSGGSLKLSLKATADDNAPLLRSAGGSMTGTIEDAKILYRFFDHKGDLVKWDYKRLEPGSTNSWTYYYGHNAPAGIYQVRYAGEKIGVEAGAFPSEKKSSLNPSGSKCRREQRIFE